MSTNQPRKPAGTPAGGQWAPAAHDEADIDLAAPATSGLWRGWEDGARPHRLTQQERDQVRAWRAVASTYRHGDCGRENHKTWPGCDIVCVSAHAKLQGDSVDLTKRPPWEKSYHRSSTKEDNAVTGLMCRLVMHAVPRPPRQPSAT